jgi:MFS family permease
MYGFFIDRIGGALFFPFLALYITDHFQVGMTEVGKIFALFAIASLIGSFIGGALTDKLGRKKMAIFGLLISGLSSLLLARINDLNLLYLIVLFFGFFSSIGEPAQTAMVADILPEDKRNEGYGILRVIANLAVVIGPAVGGILAARSYMIIFVLDAILSTITAGIVLFYLPETKPEKQGDELQDSIANTFKGYGLVIRDKVFMAIVIFTMFSTIVYMQMNSTLSVFLRDFHNIKLQQFGYLMSMNAAIVVVFQFWVSRKIKRFAPMLTLAAGTFFYMIGFSMYGFTNTYLWFILAMIIITVGEMIVSPTSQALIALLAPEDKRGRYMALFSFGWILPSMVGPLAAGIILDNYNPNWVWYAGGILTLISAVGYVSLHPAVKRRIAGIEKSKAI